MHLLRLPLMITAGLVLGTVPLLANANDLIAKGDQLANKYDAVGALKEYSAAEQMEPKNASLLLKIARQYRHAASDVSNEKEKIRLGRTALVYAEKARVLAPNDAEAHLSVAVTYGKLLPLLGNKERIEGQSKLRAAVDRALSLDPSNDLAWHVLGRWHQILSDVKGLRRGIGSMLYGSLPSTTPEAAVKCYQKAISLNPSRPRHFIELGRTYAQMGNETEARKFINKGLAMPNMEKDDPEIKAKGRETLSELK